MKRAVISFLLGISFIGVIVLIFSALMRFAPIWFEWAKYSSEDFSFFQILIISLAISVALAIPIFIVYLFLFDLNDIYEELNFLWFFAGTTVAILLIFMLLIPNPAVGILS